jgi:hypothetical protein
MNNAQMKREILELRGKIITRIMFCPVCAELQMPKVGNIVIPFGQSNQRYHPFAIKKDQNVTECGFTPHIIKVAGLHYTDREELVKFDKSCCMNGCGLEIHFSDSKKSMYEVWTLSEQFDWLSLRNFYNLIHFKDVNYYVFPK